MRNVFRVKNISIDDVPVPEIVDAHDVIVQIGQTGICGSVNHRPKLNNKTS